MKPPHHLRLMLILGALAALGPFAIDMYLPGFNAIARDFNTNTASVSLSLTSYFVGICVGQIFYGPIVDRFGRRPPMLIGVAIFALASLGCALAPGLNWLIALRLILALGGCVGMVASRAIIRDLYPPEEMPKVFSTLMLIMGAAPILAPTAGSFFVTHFGWRSIFIFLALFTILIWMTVYFLLPESRGPDPDISLRPAEVLRDYKIVLRHPDFAAYSIAGGLCMAALFTYISGAPVLFLDILKINPTHFAWLFGANALGFIAAAQLNQVILRYITPQRLIAISATLAVTIAAILLAVTIFAIPSTTLYVILIFGFMAALGPLVPNTTALALTPFSKYAGSASALIGSLQMLLAAIASALVSTLSNGTAIPMAAIMLTCAAFALAIAHHRNTHTTTAYPPPSAHQNNKK